MTKEKIARINELAHKSKTPEGLTEAEKAEQQALRQEYLADFRASFTAQLENTSIQEPGRDHPQGHPPDRPQAPPQLNRDGQKKHSFARKGGKSRALWLFPFFSAGNRAILY